MGLIAIAAEAAYTPGGSAGPWFDDQLLRDALESIGHDVTIISWEDPSIDLLQFDAIFVSSTWNGCANPAAFVAWLDACEADGRQRLINDRSVLDAGFVKYRYWRLLEHAFQHDHALRSLGQLTPSRFYSAAASPPDGVETLAGRSLTNLLAALDDDPQWAAANLVIKPVISADGIDTYVYNRFARTIPIDTEKHTQFVLSTAAAAESVFLRLAQESQRGGVLLQPYMSGVEAGEYSLTFLGRRCTHAVQKPKLFKGDGSSRRQVIALERLPGTMFAFAQEIIRWLYDHFGEGAVSRVRVDLFNQDGVPVLCELESVDPNTNIRLVAQHDSEAAKQIGEIYAAVILARTATLMMLRENQKTPGEELISPDQ